MKKTYSVEFIKANCGCYENHQFAIQEDNRYKELKKAFLDNKKTFDNDAIITANDILNSLIPLKDKYWFFIKRVFNNQQNKTIALAIAETVYPIYENNNPNNNVIKYYIQMSKLYVDQGLTPPDFNMSEFYDAIFHNVGNKYRDAAYAAADAVEGAYNDKHSDVNHHAFLTANYAITSAIKTYENAEGNYIQPLTNLLTTFVKQADET